MEVVQPRHEGILSMPKQHIAYEAMAKQLANNHASFESFMWSDEPSDAQNWCIVHTENRDSGLMQKANTKVIGKRMKRFVRDGTTREQHFTHWLCGWVDGYAIRVYTPRNVITAAFKEWCRIITELENYPILDDDLYSRMEYDATIESLVENAPELTAKAPKPWPMQFYN